MNKILALLGVAMVLVTGAAAVGLLDPGGSSARGGAVAGGAGAAAASGPSAASASVTIANFSFAPPSVHVKVGGQVTWTNTDSAAHTATADQGPSFDTGTLQKHGSKTVTFATAGTFTYHCVFHAFMKGTVIVG